MTDWRKISEFDIDELGDDEFLVAIKVPAALAINGIGSHVPFLAQWEPDRDENGEFRGEPRFQGEWRHIDEFKDCEPEAFAEIDPYEPDDGDGAELPSDVVELESAAA